MEVDNYTFNVHNKEEFPPAHTAEHLLNQLMVRMFGTERSRNAHIERKKSKMTFVLQQKPSRKEEKAITDEMNRLIEEDLPVTYELVERNNLPENVTLERLPEDASEKNKTSKNWQLRCVSVHWQTRSFYKTNRQIRAVRYKLGRTQQVVSHTF